MSDVYNPNGLLLFTPVTLSYRTVAQHLFEIAPGDVPCIQYHGASAHELYCTSPAARDALLFRRTTTIENHICRFGALGAVPRSITLKNVPYEMPLQEFFALLAPYGEVVDWAYYEDEDLPGCTNGNRRIHLLMTTPLPNFLFLGERRITCSYAGVVLLCFKCGKEDHARKDCPDAKSTLKGNVTETANGAPSNIDDPTTSTPAVSETELILSNVFSTPTVSDAKMKPPKSLTNLPERTFADALATSTPAASADLVVPESPSLMTTLKETYRSVMNPKRKKVDSTNVTSSGGAETRSSTSASAPTSQVPEKPNLPVNLPVVPAKLSTFDVKLCDPLFPAKTLWVRNWCASCCNKVITAKCTLCELIPVQSPPKGDFPPLMFITRSVNNVLAELEIERLGVGPLQGNCAAALRRRSPQMKYYASPGVPREYQELPSLAKMEGLIKTVRSFRKPF